ncbi:hypothetical protein, partial [Anaerosporobacter sp.]|uniref:hypothetical protein n=1 Tax=Anaerosporobacter sp. TaxID=1872529 RepID=UPI00289702EC
TFKIALLKFITLNYDNTILLSVKLFVRPTDCFVSIPKTVKNPLKAYKTGKNQRMHKKSFKLV